MENGIKNLGNLRKYASDNNLKLIENFQYNESDALDIRLGLKKEEECEPLYRFFGIELKNFVYLWFKSYDIDGNDMNDIYFDHFYNGNNGSVQKGYKRYINWEFKNIRNKK